MKVWHDHFMLGNLDGEYISRGYAEDEIESVIIRFEYSEEQKKENERKAKTMTPEQWTACCAAESQKKSAYIFPVMDDIAKNFVCYQHDKEHGPKYEYSDWELYFWCMSLSPPLDERTYDRDYSFIKLNFNDRHDALKHKEICNRLLLFVAERFSELDNLSFEVYHKTRFFDEKINREAAELAKRLGGMKYRYKGVDGRLLYTENGLVFMKKRARTHGYIINPREILRISWKMEAA